MNTSLASSLRSLLCAASVIAVATAAFAHPDASSDPVARALATTGLVPVKSAGPYVQVGSYHIHVLVRLGRPSSVLPDGTFLYRNFSAEESSGQGILVVRFSHGRVSQLSLATPTFVAMMMAAPVSNLTVAAK